jgi:hypothetical protein
MTEAVDEYADLRKVPLPTAAEALREKAKDMAYTWGIPFYIHDGRINQNPPGERVEPRAGSTPNLTIHNLPGSGGSTA